MAGEGGVQGAEEARDGGFACAGLGRGCCEGEGDESLRALRDEDEEPAMGEGEYGKTR